VKNVRPPAVAGMFYPDDSRQLSNDVTAMLAAVPAASAAAIRPKALIVPHAGYIYSGPIAARAYALLAPLADVIRRVILLGPTHRVSVRGLAASSAHTFITPLGYVPLEPAPLLPSISLNDAAHSQEHSLEVQLPFLQTLLENFSLLPLAVGSATTDDVADVLERLWGGPETLIVISSDLSHYHPYAEARQIDQNTVDDILHLRPLTHHEQACGAIPINGIIEVARRKHLTPHLIDLRNSGDTAGDKSRVVGYCAIAFEEPMTKPLGEVLLNRARNAITVKLGQPVLPELHHPALADPGATFVTLTQQGKLRGCIGSLEAHRPLGDDVHANAQAAAFRDPRFSPLTLEELPHTRVEVSLLAPATPMTFANEAEALRQLRPHRDGVILQWQGRRGTFLPQVWESLPEPSSFMAHLKQKAGLPTDFWAPDVQLFRYEVQKWKEP